MHIELSNLLSSSSTGFKVSLINKHILFPNTYENNQTRVLGEIPAQYRTNDTPLTKIRLLYDEFFLKKTDVYSLKKRRPATTKNYQKKVTENILTLNLIKTSSIQLYFMLDLKVLSS